MHNKNVILVLFEFSQKGISMLMEICVYTSLVNMRLNKSKTDFGGSLLPKATTIFTKILFFRIPLKYFMTFLTEFPVQHRLPTKIFNIYFKTNFSLFLSNTTKTSWDELSSTRLRQLDYKCMLSCFPIVSLSF